MGAWRHRGRDGLTCGDNTGVRPPPGVRGLSSVGHDLNCRNTVAPFQSKPQRLTARFGADGSPNPLVISTNLLNES